MLDRSRLAQLAWAVLCFVLVALVAVTVVQGWGPVTSIDNRGNPAREWAVDAAWLRAPLLVVELVFGTIGMTVLTLVLAAAMIAKGHRRAAIFAIGVMVVTALVTTGLKLSVGRARPVWQDTEELLKSKSFPSGHASGITAFGGVVIVLVIMLVRRANVRRTSYVVVGVVALVVCLDRVLLGRHYPSDVVAGVLLGAGMVLLGMVLYNPLPRSHAVKAPPLPETYPSRRRLAVVLNPIKVEDEAAFRTVVSAMALEAGWSEPSWHLTTIEDPGTGMAEAASVAGADLVLVCGGDGTVREVCAELAGTGVAVGIIPAGTGNLLARNLGIPLYLRAAIDVALTGQDRAIDLVEVSGDDVEASHFMVMAGMGIDAAMVEGVNEDIKRHVGWLAYVLSGMKSIMLPAIRVEISVDGAEPTRHRARAIVVGNVGYLQAGMPLLPDAVIDDGLIDVVLLHPQRFLSWVPLAYRVLAKRAHTDDTINRMTGRTISVCASAATPRQLDGDSIGAGRELTMTCVHGRVLVRVPR